MVSDAQRDPIAIYIYKIQFADNNQVNRFFSETNRNS